VPGLVPVVDAAVAVADAVLGAEAMPGAAADAVPDVLTDALAACSARDGTARTRAPSVLA
jgi:hypothetical protein